MLSHARHARHTFHARHGQHAFRISLLKSLGKQVQGADPPDLKVKQALPWPVQVRIPASSAVIIPAPNTAIQRIPYVVLLTPSVLPGSAHSRTPSALNSLCQ